ncbi:hypothetical protein ETT52_06390 [Streptococcus pyogenes]|nr:hypothetical protein ETT52_06390 [Streptococcus pyogenes]
MWLADSSVEDSVEVSCCTVHGVISYRGLKFCGETAPLIIFRLFIWTCVRIRKYSLNIECSGTFDSCKVCL